MDDEEVKYKIVFLDTQKVSLTSRNFTGKGRASYTNGETYEGDYVDGKREGYGVYEYKNKYKYSGNWKDN